jgi:membrane protein DedA with SNARE-associated domain
MKELIHQYGAWIVFALVFLESIGLPLPGEAILVSAAIFAGTTQDLGIALIVLAFFHSCRQIGRRGHCVLGKCGCGGENQQER